MLNRIFFCHNALLFLLLMSSCISSNGIRNGIKQTLAFAGNNGKSQNKIKIRSFVFSPKDALDKPKLVLIGGAPGTGKSTFGMSVALDQGILKCISTDTVRAVMRSFIPKDISPALHRSSYAKAFESDEDPVYSWKETCSVLETSLIEIVSDSIRRNQGLVLEGVSLAPSRKLIELWEKGGGVASGCLLTVTKEETHKALLERRGMIAGQTSEQNEKDQKKLQSFDRIRQIQDEMISLAKDSGWILIEQRVEPDPLEIIASQLFQDCQMPEQFDGSVAATQEELNELSEITQYNGVKVQD